MRFDDASYVADLMRRYVITDPLDYDPIPLLRAAKEALQQLINREKNIKRYIADKKRGKVRNIQPADVALAAWRRKNEEFFDEAATFRQAIAEQEEGFTALRRNLKQLKKLTHAVETYVELGRTLDRIDSCVQNVVDGMQPVCGLSKEDDEG